MTYNTQDYWAFGLRPSCGILENTEHNVSETRSVSILSHTSPEDSNRSNMRNVVVFCVFYNIFASTASVPVIVMHNRMQDIKIHNVNFVHTF
jgi:hypothetical protein